MTNEKGWMKYAKFFEEGEVPLSFVGEAFDYFVNFEVKESARQRADRIWRMEDRNDG